MKSRLYSFFCVLGLFCLSFLSEVNAAINIYPEPRHLPQSKIANQNGTEFSLSDFKGDFILAHFWSRDCAPCIKELKGLNSFHNKIKKSGVRLILISLKNEWRDSSEQWQFLKRYGASDLDFYVEDGSLSADFGIFTTPHTVVINTKGQEIGRLRGSEEWNKQKVIDYITDLKENHM